jgi:hypothetical protein
MISIANICKYLSLFMTLFTEIESILSIFIILDHLFTSITKKIISIPSLNVGNRDYFNVYQLSENMSP